MFRDDLSPGFVAAFTIFFLLKGTIVFVNIFIILTRVSDMNSRISNFSWFFKTLITADWVYNYIPIGPKPVAVSHSAKLSADNS